ncbi:hypothetical protein I3843_06G065400 [Carya illinoinensis]|nr:hypothetical protein I3843_06G065400 [Carya illinoinensis]
MGKQLVKLKAKVMIGLWKDLPDKIHHKVFENQDTVSIFHVWFLLYDFKFKEYPKSQYKLE